MLNSNRNFQAEIMKHQTVIKIHISTFKKKKSTINGDLGTKYKTV